MKAAIVTDEMEFDTQPKDIRPGRLWDAFDNMETEASALWLVRFAQNRGRGWAPFTQDEIETLYRTDSNGKFKDFQFNRLVEPARVYVNAAKAFGAIYGNQGHAGALLALAEQPTTEVGGGWIVRNERDGRYYFTEEFIRRCYTSSPTQPT